MIDPNIKELAKKTAFSNYVPSDAELQSMTYKQRHDFESLVKNLKIQPCTPPTRIQRFNTISKSIAKNKPINIVSNSGEHFKISPHAIQRFLERCPTAASCNNIFALIKKDLSHLKPAFENEHDLFMSKLSHNFENAKYAFGGITGLLYVIINKNIVKTIHRNESGRWKRFKR